LNLADCYEREGKLASAWARFHEAIALAQRLGRPDREKTAKERADKLEPRLARITILSQDKDVTIALDGNALDPAVLGTALPIDPGKHTVEASAKGKKPYATTIDVGERVKSRTVEIPALEAEPEATAPGAPPKKTPDEPQKPADGSTQRTLGLVAMGIGVVGIGVGAFFGLRTSSKWSDAQAHCTNGECDKEGVQLATDAKNAGNVSTIAFIAGGVLAAGGAVLFFMAPGGGGAVGGAPAAVRVGVGPGNVVVGGRF
jgi:hypothetical protein